MLTLNLKPNHKATRDYYATLQQYNQHNVTHEGAVSSPFEALLHACAKQMNATLIPQYAMQTAAGNRIVIDGVILDEYELSLAYWEAKDIDGTLIKAIQEKCDADYPLDNILFQTPQRAILYQNGRNILDLDISEPARLITVLQHLFSYAPPALDNWHTAVSDFRAHVPDLAAQLKELIDKQHKTDETFRKAFAVFYQTCRTSINPELSQAEVFDYRLGSRSALKWIVDQYQVKIDKRSGIVNDPNRVDAPRVVVDLIGRVIYVSLKTVEIVKSLPKL